jgi:hypothetical protein
MCITQYGDIIFPPITVVIENENQKTHYLCEVLPVIGFLNTKIVHRAEIHKHIVQCMENVKGTKKM